jgi:hypothetical protein
VLEKDLLPILVNSREDGEAFDAAVRLLVNLTVPVECLLPIGTRQQTVIFDIPDSVRIYLIPDPDLAF